jgi:hypothetical protein
MMGRIVDSVDDRRLPLTAFGPMELRMMRTAPVDKNWITNATVLLIASGGIVAVAVAIGGNLGRALNGVGGLGWMIGAAILVIGLRRIPSRWRGFAIAAVVALGLSWFLSASDLTAAVIGFGIAGAFVAAATVERRGAWALLVPALWLPLHVGTAIVRAAVAGESRVRTDPPPTAALVPLAMIVAAWGCGMLVEFVAGRRPSAGAQRVLATRR